MSVLAWNAMSSIKEFIVVVTIDIDCLAPNSSIVNSFMPRNVMRSVAATFDGTFSINCTTVVGTR
jgi:hypothetical protein